MDSINQAQLKLQRISLYPLVSDNEKYHLTTSSAETLVAVSHSIEEAVIHHHLRGTFYASFQRISSFIPQINRFAKLASICGEVLVFAYPDTAVPEIPGVKFVLLDEVAPLADEWFIVFASAELQIALLTRQTDDDPAPATALYHFGRGRSYQGTVTTQPDLVLTARKMLDQALRRTTPALTNQSADTMVDPQHPILTFGQKLTSYLEERNRELTGLYRTLAARTETMEKLQQSLRTMISRTAWQQAKESNGPNGSKESETQPSSQQRMLTIDTLTFWRQPFTASREMWTNFWAMACCLFLKIHWLPSTPLC